jgi:hypothetical protein
LEGQLLRQIFRNRFPAVERGVLQIELFLQDLAAGLQLKGIGVAAGNFRDLLSTLWV